ncbi:hypothetical protein [Nonomuraea cavernae]|nr:hypothetical protein [Nonomuraea cavernae]
MAGVSLIDYATGGLVHNHINVFTGSRRQGGGMVIEEQPGDQIVA